MKLEDLRRLDPADQQTFLLGRIALETTRMDAVLRLVHAVLDGRPNSDSTLDAPDNFSRNVMKCRQLLANHQSLNDRARVATLEAVAAAAAAYGRRNRYIHDFLLESFLGHQWELVRLTRQPPDKPDTLMVSFDDMVSLVLELVAATWRLRGCAMYAAHGGWESMALGEVTGGWDGSAESAR